MNIKITYCDFCEKKITIGESFYLIKRLNYTERICSDCKQALIKRLRKVGEVNE